MDKLQEEAQKNYSFDATQSFVKHNLSDAKLNEKIVFLIKNGWTFCYPPQNVSSDQDKSMMNDPKTNIGHHYIADYEMVKNPTLFD